MSFEFNVNALTAFISKWFYALMKSQIESVHRLFKNLNKDDVRTLFSSNIVLRLLLKFDFFTFKTALGQHGGFRLKLAFFSTRKAKELFSYVPSS